MSIRRARKQKVPDEPSSPAVLRFLSKSWWGGIGVIAGIVITAVLFQFEGLRDRVLDTANIAAEHSYHRDEFQEWRLVAILTNEGPGTAQIVNSVLTPTNSMCFNVTIDAETGDVLESTEVENAIDSVSASIAAASDALAAAERDLAGYVNSLTL